MLPKVTIIMTSYNKPDFVAKAIHSVVSQTYQDFELLIMDDNSSGDTLAAIEPFLDDARIQLFRSDIQTIAERVDKTRYAVLINQALERAKGKFISYITDDNVYKPCRIAKMVRYLEQHPEVNIVYSGSVTKSLNERGEVTNQVVRKAKQINWIAPCAIDHCSFMHRASVLPIIKDQFGSYWDEDPQFYRLGDARFFWRLNHHWPFYPINETLDENYITPVSIHYQIFAEKQSEFAAKLPEQRTCKELREQLRALGRK